MPNVENLASAIARLCRQFELSDLDQRRDAAEALGELAREHGPALAPAVPALMAALADPDERLGQSALWALRYCAPESLPGLIAALSHPAALVRERAAHALGNVGVGARDAAGALRGLLRDGQPAVRKRAAWALGLMRESSAPTLDELWRLVAQGSSSDRGAALHALGNIGRALDEPAVFEPYRGLIVDALTDADDDVRWSALHASDALAWTSEARAGMLAGLFASDASSQVLDAVLSRLEDLAPGVDLSPWVHLLVAKLGSDEVSLWRVCDVLGAMRPPPLAAAPALMALLEGETPALSAARALWRMQRDPVVLIPVLRRLMQTDDESVCDLICEMGSAAAPLLPEVLAVLGRDDWDAQWAAVDALAAIASDDAGARQALLHALGHGSPRVRSGAARGLARQGADAVPELRRIVLDVADDRCAWAAYALGSMGEVAAEAMGELRRGLAVGVEPLAGACAVAMARIGSAESVPALVRLLNSGTTAQRVDVAEALGQLGPAATAAVAALKDASVSLDDELASTARAALGQIGQAVH